MQSLYYVAIFFAIFAYQIVFLEASLFGLLSSESCECIDTCPKFNEFTVDLTNPSEDDANSLYFIEKLWSSSYPVLSKKGQALKEAFLYLGRSDIPLWKNTAIIGTVWIWSAITAYKSKPVFCGFTQIINATVASFDCEVNCCDLRIAAQSMSDSVMDGAKYVAAAALKNSNCCKKHTPTPSMVRCCDDGSIYPINEFWDRVGLAYPCIFEKAVKKMYKSSCYLDRFMAAVATAATTDHLAIFHANFDKQLLFTGLKMQTTEPINRACCKKFKKELAETLSVSQCAADFSAYKLLEANGCVPLDDNIIS